MGSLAMHHRSASRLPRAGLRCPSPFLESATASPGGGAGHHGPCQGGATLAAAPRVALCAGRFHGVPGHVRELIVVSRVTWGG
jgi:hypothetical protein